MKNNRMIKLTALLLTLVGILAFLPSEALATWVIRHSSAGADFQSTQGDITVHYKFFGEDVFVPGVSSTKYYTDATLGTELSAAQVEALKNGIKGNSNKIAIGSQSSNATTQDHYRAGCNKKGTAYAVSLLFSQPSFTVTVSDNNQENEDPVKTITLPLTTDYTTGVLTGTSSYTTTIGAANSDKVSYEVESMSVDNGDGTYTKVYLDVYYAWDPSSLSINVTTNGSVGGGPTWMGGLNCNCGWSDSHYKYKATGTFTPNVYCVTYVRVETVTELDKVVPFMAFAEGETLYSVGGYARGDTIEPLEFSTVHTVLPSDVREAARCINGYCTMKVENGEYTVGASYAMPLVITSELVQTDPSDQKYIEIWVNIGTVPEGTNHPKTDHNAALLKGASMMLGGSSALKNANDVTGDIAYNAGTNTFGLYASTINGILELGFAYDSTTAKTNVNGMPTGSSPKAAENILYHSSGNTGSTLKDKTASLSNNTCDYTVVLQSDLVLNGTLIVGGYTGMDYATSTNVPQGFIIRNYVALDLNGHTLTVNGTLHSFGHIYDSTGKGRIVVTTTGTLYTQLLIHGMSGLQHTLKSYDVGYCPFEDYNMPYLETTVEILSETTYTKTLNNDGSVTVTEGATASGTMYGFTMINLGSYAGAFNCYLKLFGAENGNEPPLFSLIAEADTCVETPTAESKTITGRANGKTLVSTKTLESLSSSLETYCTDKKNTFDFYDVRAVLHAPKLSFTLTVDVGFSVTISPVLKLERVAFPISAFVDINFHSSEMVLGQQILVMPGCTMTFDEDSILRLVCSGEQTFGGVSELGTEGALLSRVNPFYGSVTKKVTGGILVHTYDMRHPEMRRSFNGGKNGVVYGTHSADFWNYFGTGKVNVYGTLEMAQKPVGTYVLAGNINITDFCTFNASTGVRTDRARWCAENLDAAHLSLLNLRTYDVTAALALSTVGGMEKNHVVKIAHHSVMTLTSNGSAYAYAASYAETATTVQVSLLGSYNVADGVFTEITGETYVILPNVAVPSYNKNGILSYVPTIVRATVHHEIAVVNDAQYVYYAGAYVPVATGVADPTSVVAGDTCTIDGLAFISSGTGTDYTQTLTWNGTVWEISKE